MQSDGTMVNGYRAVLSSTNTKAKKNTLVAIKNVFKLGKQFLPYAGDTEKWVQIPEYLLRNAYHFITSNSLLFYTLSGGTRVNFIISSSNNKVDSSSTLKKITR